MNLKKIFGNGLALAIPIAVVGYVFFRIILLFKKMIGPLANRLGIERILGELSLTVFATLLMLVLITLLGLLMRISRIAAMKQQVERVILTFIPALNQLKLMTVDQFNLEEVENDWEPVLFFHKEEQKYNAGFIVEQDDRRVVLFVTSETAIKNGEIMIIFKDDVIIIPITYTELYKCTRAAGKGFLKLINRYEQSL